MTDPADRAAFLKLAEYWKRLGELAEKKEAENSPKERSQD
jgi:hypothetical protein